MAQLVPSLLDFVIVGEKPIHGADRAMVDALVEQRGIDFIG
jgi:hypothetical protein